MQLILTHNHFRMNISEKKRGSDKKAEQQRVAATLEGAQPRPNTSAVQTAAGAIAEPIASRAQGGSQQIKNVKGSSPTSDKTGNFGDIPRKSRQDELNGRVL